MTQVRDINWGKTFNWDLRIPGAPAPFNNWFPATEIDRGHGALSQETITVGPYSFEIPNGGQQKQLRLTFADDDKATLENWIADWFNKRVLSDEFGGVAPLEDCMEQFQVALLDNARQLVATVIYLVTPVGTYNSQRDSQAQNTILVASFNIMSREVSRART
jgi:hypothetical protein